MMLVFRSSLSSSAMKSSFLAVFLCWFLLFAGDGHSTVTALVPFLDGGNGMPKLYQGYFDGQIAKQAKAAVGRAINANIKQMEVNFPPVPNLEEVKFGTPLNQKFGKSVVATNLKIPGGYTPGSDLSRQQVAFANMYWAKELSTAMGGNLFGTDPVNVLSAEPVTYSQIKSPGNIRSMGPLQVSRVSQPKPGSYIVINPGGEETWKRIQNTYMTSSSNDKPMLILNNAYSTTYGLGNQLQNYEEVYYMKRISKGWIYRSYPGPWEAYLETPTGQVELLTTYKTKPKLNEVATMVRDESFKRYAISNDRWSPGFGERL